MINYHHQNRLEIPTILDQKIDDQATLGQSEANQVTQGGSYVIDNITNHDHDEIKKQWTYNIHWFDDN